MNICDIDTVPSECAQWCHANDYGTTILDDIADVDLDWWNTRLADHKIPVRISGRDPDGTPITGGRAFLRRGDIPGGVLPDAGRADLAVLYRAAAWLFGRHEYRQMPIRCHRARFVDVRSPSGGAGDEFTAITNALRVCRQTPLDLHDPGGAGPWPRIPGVGPVVLSLYLWAACHTGGPRPQLLDQDALSSLCYLGSTQRPVANDATRNRYRHYNRLLYHWADQANTCPELVEMWLTITWRQRAHHAAGGHTNASHH